ncbi:hypothetical protein QQP08_022785 [Theobroma cacao]|nr:hypothetical protein QQP08_022785 [Theobroma cacao]
MLLVQSRGQAISRPGSKPGQVARLDNPGQGGTPQKATKNHRIQWRRSIQSTLDEDEQPYQQSKLGNSN